MRKRKVICGILLSGALLYSGIFAVQGAEHRVIRSTSNDYQQIKMYYCWDKIVYQVANQKVNDFWRQTAFPLIRRRIIPSGSRARSNLNRENTRENMVLQADIWILPI